MVLFMPLLANKILSQLMRVVVLEQGKHYLCILAIIAITIIIIIIMHVSLLQFSFLLTQHSFTL